jgi:PDZ domain/Aspartyl protease
MQRIMTVALLAGLMVSTSLQGSAQKRRRGTRGQVPPVTSRFTSGKSARIPLEIDNNIIFLKVRVNGSRPLKFVFDTGASVSGINSALLAELGLKPGRQAQGTATGGNIQVGLINGVSLSVEGAEVANQIIASLSLAETPCVEFDGFIGYDFINQFIVEIDYQAKVINLYDRRTYVYSGQGRIVPLVLAGRRTPLVLTNITVDRGRSIVSRLELDTGGDSAFIINSPFVKRHELMRSLSRSVAGSQVGAGGEQKLVVGRVKNVQLGPFTIDSPILSLSQDTQGFGASEESDGILGGEVLRRFKVILDYSRQRLILEPNSDLNQPYEVGMTGFSFGSKEEDCKVQRIESIEPHSPASDAGLQPGDIITAIDGRAVSDIPSNELEQLFKQNGRELTLTIKRDSQSFQKKLRLRRLI